LHNDRREGSFDDQRGQQTSDSEVCQVTPASILKNLPTTKADAKESHRLVITSAATSILTL
jgi:hypothetical protein